MFPTHPDWEYPGYAPHAGTPEDTANFNLLLDDVRAALDGLGEETGQFYGLTAALPCGPSIIANMDIAHVSKLVSGAGFLCAYFGWHCPPGGLGGIK